MNQFVKPEGKRNTKGFKYIAECFPKITQTKLKEAIRVAPSPRIREVLRDVNFKTTLDEMELPAWNGHRWIYGNFLGDTKAIHYKDGDKYLMKYYSGRGCRMSL